MRPPGFGLAMVAAASVVAAQETSSADRVRALIAEGDRYLAASVRRPDLALARFTEADRLAAATSDPRLGAVARVSLAGALFGLDRLSEAEAAGRQAAALAARAEAPEVEGDALRVLGAALLQLARFEEAEEVLRRSADLSLRYGNPDQTARAYSNLSVNARMQGKLTDAIGFGRKAVSVVDEALARGETMAPRTLFASPFNLGKALANSGDYTDSRAYLDRAFATAQESGDIGGQMHVLFDTGEWYEALGDLDRAERYYARSVEFARAHRSGEESEGKSLAGLGRVAFRRGRFADAARYLGTAVSVFERRELEFHVMPTLVDLARARAASGDQAGADREIARAIRTARKRNNSLTLVRALVERGRGRTREGDWSGARADFDAALEEAGREGLLPLVPEAWAGHAALAEARGDPAAATAAYEQAAKALDRIHGRIVSPELRTSFAAATHEVFAGMVRVMVQQHLARPEQGHAWRALAALEQQRTRAMMVSLPDEGKADAGPPRSEARITAIQNALFVPDLAVARRRQLLKDLDDAERDLALLGSGSAAPLQAVTSVREVQAALATEEVALVYVADKRQSEVFLLTQSSLRVVPLSLPEDLEARVVFFIRALEGNARDASIGAGRVLARALIEPVLDLLPPGSQLLFLTAGPLARLPMAALPIPDDHKKFVPLMSRHQVAFLHSLTLFARSRREGVGPLERRVLAVADPTGPAAARSLAALPASRVEAEAVARQASVARLLVGAEATEGAVKRAAAENYAVWHLATHARLDPSVPERSAVLLGPSAGEDGLLQGREIFRLPLQGSLVVLSGCRTADGQISGAEGLRSLARAFLRAGGRAVVGALWDLPDAGAERMVTNFYRGLNGGRDAGRSMREAQRVLAGPDPYGASRTWASMVIIGDPSVTLRASSLLRPLIPVAAALGLVLFGILARRRAGHPRTRTAS